jgi:ISXO2-like transposase domain
VAVYRTTFGGEPTKKQSRPPFNGMLKSDRIVDTDESGAYTGIHFLGYTHGTVNHGAGEYVREDVTTNGIESVFAVLKRGLIGVYHHASPKHLDRYVDEFSFRLNEGNVKNHTLRRLDSFVDGTAGKRLTYKALIQ